MPIRTSIALLLPLAGLVAACPGCVWYGPHSMTRAWADRNTLNRPAIFVERLSHTPPPRERVERFRWQYGVGPGIPFVAPEETYVAAPPMIPSTGPPEEPGSLGAPVPPPAAPPESVPTPAEAQKPTAKLAWLFAPSRG